MDQASTQRASSVGSPLLASRGLCAGSEGATLALGSCRAQASMACRGTPDPTPLLQFKLAQLLLNVRTRAPLLLLLLLEPAPRPGAGADAPR